MTKFAKEINDKICRLEREKNELETEIEILKEQICPRCDGEGFISDYSSVVKPTDYEKEINCPDCRGTGVIG